MATVIDGTSIEGYWKIYDEGTPTDYVQVPKGEMFFDAGAKFLYLTSDYAKNNPILNLEIDAATLDGEGNLLNTKAKVCEYLSKWR